jgi:hypothetical protein
MTNSRIRIMTLSHRCVTQHLSRHQHSYTSTVSKAVVIAIQDIMDTVGELAIAVMAAEDIVVLSGHRRLTSLVADDSGGMEVDTIMALEVVVGMVEVVIQGTVLITPRGRYSSDSMVVVAAVVEEVLFRVSIALCLQMSWDAFFD